jgi:hypothetical protein
MEGNDNKHHRFARALAHNHSEPEIHAAYCANEAVTGDGAFQAIFYPRN